MLNLKKVIVTQRIDHIKNYSETRESIDQALSEWLIQADYLPIPISNKLVSIHNNQDIQVNEQPLLQNWLSVIKPNALLISGGNNIGAYPARDETEKFLLKWAQKNRTPVLGICRGMQMMAVWAGGNLDVVNNHVGTRHQLNIYGSNNNWPNEVNSYHEWGLFDCPSDFEIKAHSDDGVIEAIRHKELPWEGWMWHPEREAQFAKKDIDRIKQLFNIKD